MLALITDLIFATKVTSTARSMGASIKLVRSADALGEALSTGQDRLVLIDLNAEGVDVLSAIRACSAAPHRPRTICYASHMQAELIEAARQAGADEVMARSAFVAKLPRLFENVPRSSAAQPHSEAQS